MLFLSNLDFIPQNLGAYMSLFRPFVRSIKNNVDYITDRDPRFWSPPSMASIDKSLLLLLRHLRRSSLHAIFRNLRINHGPISFQRFDSISAPFWHTQKKGQHLLVLLVDIGPSLDDTHLDWDPQTQTGRKDTAKNRSLGAIMMVKPWVFRGFHTCKMKTYLLYI